MKDKIFNAKSIRLVNVVGLFIIGFLSILLLSEPTIFHANMVTYSPAEIHGYDNALFTQDIDVKTSEGAFSPRAGSIGIVSCLMGLGLSYEYAYLLLFVISCSVFAIGGVVFVYLADLKNKLLGVLLFSIIIGISRIHYFAGFYVFTLNSIFIGLGSAFGILAVILLMYKPDNKRINIAYLLLAIAAVCHIHEGIWAFCLVSFIYLCTYKNVPYNIVSFYVSIIAILAMTIPAMLTGTYHMPASDFFDIYVQERIPHHLLVSNMEGWRGVLYMAALYGSIVWLNRDVLKKDNKFILFNGLIILFFAIIAVWYASTEIFHVPTFVKLYFAKFIKYISIPFSLLLIQYVSRAAEDKKILATAMILCLLVDREIWPWMMLLVHIVYNMPINNPIQKYGIWAVVYMICIMLCMWQSPLATKSTRLIFLTMTLMLLFPKFKSYAYASLIMIVFVGSFGARMYKYGITSINKFIEFYMVSEMGTEQYIFANAIQTIVPKDEMILCDAKDQENGYIQHVSRRSMYALYKTVPSSDLGIKIWHDRIEETEDFCAWTPERMADYMSANHIRYVSVNKSEMDYSYKESPMFSLQTETDNYQLYLLK